VSVGEPEVPADGPVEDGPVEDGPVEDGPVEEEGAVALPPLADTLMAPLLEAGGELLRRMPPADVPPAARRLRSFDRRGLATPAARRQLRRLLEEDEELLTAAASVLLARPEAARVADAWQQAAETGGDAPLALVAEMSGDGRLALLASVLAAGVPTGFEFGLGLVVAVAATADRETAAAQAVRAATTAQGSAEEARRRADAARAAAEETAARLDAALREERRARLQLEQQAGETAVASETRREALESALAGAEQRAVAAERQAAEARQRMASAEQGAAEARRRAVSAEQDLAEAEHRIATAEQRAADAERRALAAEQEIAEAAHRTPAAGSGTGGRWPGRADGDGSGGALDEVARAAEDLAAALRRLASGPSPGPGLPSGAPPGGTSAAPVRPAPGPGRAGGPARRSEPPAGGRPAPVPARRPAASARRAAVRIPPGMQQDDPAALAAMVRTPGLAVIVDGYNVSMLAWPDTTAADQRDRLCHALTEFQLRMRCEVTVVFDGADVPGVRPLRRRGIRVVFSAPGQEADEVLVDEVVFRPADVPVLVVTSDREVAVAAEGEGATVVPSARFLQLIRR
jgi:predicted RNA-binding protein with PIN domain